MRAYSQDLRDRVLYALERGERPTHIATRLEVSRSWVHQVRNHLQSEGRRTSLQIGGHRISVLSPLEAEIRAWIADKPDITLAEICERLVKEKKVTIKVPALWHQLNKWGLSYKKNSARQRARTTGRATSAERLEAKPANA